MYKVKKDKSRERAAVRIDRQHVAQAFLDLCEDSLFLDTSTM